jgi:hypothetical protein
VLRLPRYQTSINGTRCGRKPAVPGALGADLAGDELTEGAYRARVIRGKQEYASGQAIPLLLFHGTAGHCSAASPSATSGAGAAQSCMIGYWMGEAHLPARAICSPHFGWLYPISFRRA